jgi:hypothetical protein
LSSSKCETAYGRVLERLGKLVVEHPMPLCEFPKRADVAMQIPPGSHYRLTVTHSGWQSGRDWGIWRLEYDADQL